MIGEIKKEIHSFYNDKIIIGDDRYAEAGDNRFSQPETISTIDLYIQSKYTKGKKDSEGVEKRFINRCVFAADVASKMIDLDVNNFVFMPNGYENLAIATELVPDDFRDWAKDNGLSKLLNKQAQDITRYGHIVLKSVKGKVEPVRLQDIIIQQDAESIEKADYFTIKHEMSQNDLEKYDQWDISDIKLKLGQKITVYERYGEVKESFVKDGGSDEKYVDAITIVAIGDKLNKVLYKSAISKRPFLEYVYEKIEGRWQGRGEIEKQFENQMAKNEVINLARRSMLWASKKVFKANNEMLFNSLLTEVRDGDILDVGVNGDLSQVDMSTRSMNDYSFANNEWEENSNQKAFTFEVATGESMPSGTPYRLGVQLSSAVSSHFEKKKEDFGLFWRDVITQFVFPEFKKNAKEHLQSFSGEKAGTLKRILTENLVFKNVQEQIKKGFVPDVDKIRQDIEVILTQRKQLLITVLKDAYDDLGKKVTLEITGETVDVKTKMETMKGIFEIVSSNPNALADPTLKGLIGRSLALIGESVDILAPAPNMQLAQAPSSGGQGGFQVPTAQPDQAMQL